MELYCATSDVKSTGGDKQAPPSVDITTNAPPEVQKPATATNLQTGVSTNSALSGIENDQNKNLRERIHWYALRATYGRGKRAYEYLLGKKVEAFYPTFKSIKVVNGKRVSIEESRIPNLLFARGTEKEIKAFVYDNVNLPFLRFYYRHTHIGNKRVKEPLIVPDCQMDTLMVVCAAETDDIIASTEEITKFEEGQMVRITDGKFKGVVGTVARYKSQQRVGIVIEGLLTVCTAYVPNAFIESII